MHNLHGTEKADFKRFCSKIYVNMCINSESFRKHLLNLIETNYI